ncbi:similar to Saccharomyces cerevisiae YLR435W TSR2 Protein with a potential role in pre-rRNA processing [Maudiozyma barnettii]|uniref:Similar to Saccharomyces cerevisiae YLR435W TSR2 Protein with a potential role in pre-rRNA processing n=1 Tax=Maudiozyma barnettii TaxID=61262 RepID=A0A8H2VJJ2_9SACH|nr:Tsr2p [Kazachstania barnettii]CAB4256525.1 similar to Saccharomyces cerevisiae YLR435W TSR2 Protein with a potential role in pre-rRNA processing [Kazachstania barnettii]CAD1785128.1 similar to Saccharomyces cerevisiae YLR435W TSR2 Protein with a potential role in pre-rRNA processing [Kazachstania barnettii]
MSSLTIDESAFVEATNDANTLEFSDEKQQGRFELGISMLIYSWDALDIAVANQWGGIDSADKRDWITAIVIDLFKTNKIVDIAMVEETLLYAMVDEFDTNVEDDTSLIVASNVIKLYEECYAMNYGRVEELYARYVEKEKNRQGKPDQRIVHVHGDDDSSCEEDEEDEDEDMMELVVEEEEIVTTTAEPIIDDDGFELVQKKGKRKF